MSDYYTESVDSPNMNKLTVYQTCLIFWVNCRTFLVLICHASTRHVFGTNWKSRKSFSFSLHINHMMPIVLKCVQISKVPKALKLLLLNKRDLLVQDDCHISQWNNYWVHRKWIGLYSVFCPQSWNSVRICLWQSSAHFSWTTCSMTPLSLAQREQYCCISMWLSCRFLFASPMSPTSSLCHWKQQHTPRCINDVF